MASPLIEDQEQSGGHHRAPRRRHHGEGSPAHGRELAEQNLALDLHPHQKEEHRHQSIVDPVEQGHFERPVAQHEPGVRVPQIVVARAERRVGDEQGKGRRGEHDDSARRLESDEALERP
jgi:hypothetical protein